MYNDYRIVAVTPAGRRRYLEVLAPQILREPIIDEWRLWINTTNNDDISCIQQIASANAGRVTLEYGSNIHPAHGHSIFQFFRNCCDPGTIYIRFDDDICYLTHDAILNLIARRIRCPQYFLVFANIVNNSIISHLYQRFGYLPSEPYVGYNCTDHVGWNDPRFAESVHRRFFQAGPFYMSDWILNIYERFSINCFAFFGYDFAQFGGHVDPNEECWLTIDKARQLGRYNIICGDSVVCHFAYYPQRAHMDTTDILQRYKELSMR